MADYCHFLNVLKPKGITSFSVVGRVRRLAGTRRVGHLGTLDPMAEGVLPVALGTATRLIEYVSGDKRYVAEVTLGIRTDTLDAEGQVLVSSDATHVKREDVLAALAQIRRQTEQIPPMASALHHEGRRLYELFREGVTVALPPRPVRLDRVDLLAFEAPRCSLDVECGPGTYIRSIARDLGEVLGCGAHLSALVRTRRGPFVIDQGIPLERLDSEGVAAHLLRPQRVLDRVRWLTVSEDAVATLRHGGRIAMQGVENMIDSPNPTPSALGEGSEGLQSLCALADRRGNLIAIARPGADTIQPLKVFADTEGELT